MNKPKEFRGSAAQPVVVSQPDTLLSPEQAFTPRQAAFIQRQQRIGMDSVRRQLSAAIQREDVPVADSSAGGSAQAGASLETWPDSLPRANRVTAKLPNGKRDPAKDTNIVVNLGKKEQKTEDTEVGEFDQVSTEKKKEVVTHAPTLGKAELGLDGTLSEGQQQVVNQIRANREAVDPFAKRASGGKLHLYQYDGSFGWQYGGAPGQDATPTAVQGEADASTIEGKKKRAEQYVWEELRHEGSSASINAYDPQMVTWGRGLGGKGYLPPAMEELFKDSEIASQFLRMGVCYRGGWLVVNTLTGAVETGANALAIMQTDPHILAAMIDIGEKQENKQKIADAQWTGIRAAKTSLIPFDEALDWPKEIIQWMAHINHWGPAYGWWGKMKGDYKAAGADALNLLKVYCRAAAGKPNANGSYSIMVMGPDTVANFGHWGGGIGLRTITGNFREESLSEHDILNNAEHKGKAIIKRSAAGKDSTMPTYTYQLE
jgi:hypothetical protein